MSLTTTIGVFPGLYPASLRKIFVIMAALLMPACDGLAQDESAAEQKFFAMMNEARVAAGLPSLKSDPQVKAAARSHLSAFITNRKISTRFAGEAGLQERLESAGVLCGAATEIMTMAPDLNRPLEELIGSDSKKVLLDSRLTVADVAAVKDGNMWFVVADLIQPQQGLSIEEVEKKILASIHDLRRKKELSQLKGFWSKRLRAVAGEMAKKNSLKVEISDPPDALSYGGDRAYAQSYAYTTLNPQNLPQSLIDMPYDPKITAVAVGVCYGKSKTYPNGICWIVVQLYAAPASERKPN